MPELRQFNIERSGLSLRIHYNARSWMLVHEIPRLYEALLQGLDGFGVSPQDIRSDNGDGSLGGYGVNLWMSNFGAHVRLSLTGADLSCADLSRVDLDQLERAFVCLTDSLITAADNDLVFASYAVTNDLHGHVEDLETKDYLARFVNTPDVEELGPSLGSGAFFYFGERPPVAQSRLSVDLSGVIVGCLHIGAFSMLDGSALGPSDIRNAITERLRISLEAVGLRADLR